MWKRYLAFVMIFILVLHTASAAVYAGERTDIVQNGTTVAESSEKPENREETENPDKTDQTDREQDSESEPGQPEDENPEENSGEETASSEENTGQENLNDSTEEERPAENPGEEDESGQDQSEENADEEQFLEDVEQEEDIEADEVEETEELENEETMEKPIDTESSKLASVYATDSTGEYQPEGASYKLTYTEVTGGVKITGITGTKEGELKIPAQIDGMDVVEIGDNAFASCNKLIGNLILPSSVTVIGNSTFSGCDGLTGELVLPEGITLIGERAFDGCRGFTGKLNIPDNVNIIPDYTFDGCTNILEVRIHKNVEKLGKYAFRHGFYRRKTYIFNSNLEISSDEVGDYNLIYGYPGSAAEEYVKNNSKHNTFISLDNPLEIKEYHIKNTQELLDAIGPYRRIILADGLYDLGWEYFGIRDQIDLSIEAEHPGKAELLSREKTRPVIEIDSSMGVHISGCILGHESVEKGDACGDHGYVIEVWNSTDIEINNCDLYGCGIWGISTVGSTITIEESVIRDCMEGIVKDDHKDIVSLRNCILSGNAYDDKWEAYPAFSCKCNLTVQDCIFLNNHNSNLICDENKASIDNCSFYNNVWDGGAPKPSGICLNGITWQMDGNVLKLGYPLELDNGTILSQTGKVLDYSASSAPWKNYKFSEVQYAEGVEKPDKDIAFTIVESINLGMDTLTLSVDDTAALTVEITPDSAAETAVTWTSSDTSVAKVENGLVTAISSGECTITASAGGKSATCLVIVNEPEDDYIYWNIDANGKLTVEGSGDFADSNSTDRAPWFENRSAIKSAEINLTGTTNAAYMFYDCQNLTIIDMSRFDVGNVTSFTGFWDSCPKLSTIHVPCHLKESVVLLELDPLYIWSDTEGNTYTELPKNLDHSIVLTRTQKPVTAEPYITLDKVKTNYIVGEQLNTDDLEVTYYDETGTPSKVNDYTTNANEIDMSIAGIKTLVVTYQNLTAAIEITVSERQPEVEHGLKILFKNEQDQEVVYTGSAIKPELKVSYNGRPLMEGTNYTVKYSNNVKVGNAKITVTGKGNFKSNKTEYFKIVQADIANAEFAGTDQEGQLVVVQGSKFAPVIYCGNRKLSTNDYSLSGMIQAGKKITDGDSGKVITIKGEGNYIGSKEITLKVVKKNNLTKFTVTLDKTKLNALTYDGRAHYIHEIQGALKVTGKDGNTNMQRGIDYMVVYPANVTDAGTKKISVVGMGLYTGTVSKSYTIKPAVNTSGFVNVEYESGNIERIKLPYRSTGVTFNDQIKVTYTKDGNTLLLREGKDYKVTYSGNKKVGNKAKFMISFLGNYKSLKKQTRMFTIEKADLENASVVIADAVYKKKPGIYKSVPYLIEPETGRLINASNYQVSYYIDETRNIEMKGNNKVSSGDIVYVKIEAKANGNYRSNTPIVKTYRVADAINLSNVKISFIDAKTEYATKTAEYTGHKITDQEIKVLINGKRADEDVVITYANNIAKGKATVIITGTGKPGCKYTGCKKASFNIVAYSLR